MPLSPQKPAPTRNLAAPIRRELVGRLAVAGMSTRAIAPAVGVSNKTVSIDRREVLPQVTPDPLAEEKADGRVVKLTGPGSLLAIGRRLEELERPKAAERQAEGRQRARP